jgi:hypothetical protein
MVGGFCWPNKTGRINRQNKKRGIDRKVHACIEAPFEKRYLWKDGMIRELPGFDDKNLPIIKTLGRT